MTGYEAFARVERGRVATPGWAWRSPGVQPEFVAAEASDATTGSLDQAPGHDWLASLREHWAMTTFFLFDPDSWR